MVYEEAFQKLLCMNYNLKVGQKQFKYSATRRFVWNCFDTKLVSQSAKKNFWQVGMKLGRKIRFALEQLDNT